MSDPKPKTTSDAPADKDDTELGGGITADFFYRLQVMALTLLTFVLAVYILREFESVLKPFFIAILIAYAIAPLYRWLVGHRCPPLLAYVLIALSLLGLFAGIGRMVYTSIDGFSARLPQYEEKLLNLNRQLNERLPMLDIQQAYDFIAEESGDPQRWLSLIQAALGEFIGFLGVTLIVVFYLVFLLVEQHAFSRRIQKAFSKSRSDEVLNIVTQINSSIANYISVKTLMSLLTGLLTTIVLLIFGVEFAVMWGVITFLANFIPYVGSMVAVLLPAGLSLVQFENPLRALVILLTLTAIQQAIGLILEPLVAGNRLNVSPLLIVLSLAFWGFIWGIAGMILAVPILMVIKTSLDHIPATASAGRLLSKV